MRLIFALCVLYLLPTSSSLAAPPRVSRRGLGRALVGSTFVASLIPPPALATPPSPGSPPNGAEQNQEKSLLSTFSYPEPEPFVLRSQQLKIGKAAKPMKGAGELKERKEEVTK